MGVEIKAEAGLLLARVRGQMAVADQRLMVAMLHEALQHAGRTKILVVVDRDFAGWTSGEDWSESSLQFEGDEQIEKAAFVCESRWQEQVAVFIAQPFRRMAIEFFSSEDAARGWLQS